MRKLYTVAFPTLNDADARFIAAIRARHDRQATLLGPPAARARVIDHSVHEVALFKKLGQEPYGFTGRVATRVTVSADTH